MDVTPRSLVSTASRGHGTLQSRILWNLENKRVIDSFSSRVSPYLIEIDRARDDATIRNSEPFALVPKNRGDIVSHPLMR